MAHWLAWRRFAGISLLFLAAFVRSAQASAASPVATSSRMVATQPCHTLYVRLNGSQPTVNRCLDGETPVDGSTLGIGPDTYLDSGCNASALWIYADSNLSGDRICFRGSGSVNMGDYTYNCSGFLCYSWNDVASSYYSGCSGGTFYVDANTSGTSQPFGSYISHNFDGQSGRLPNDTLSSLRLNSNC